MRAIIVEGADGLGKTTISKYLAQILKWKWIRQPNPDNTLGWVRKEVKQNPDWNPVERQLLHTCSHIVDYLTVKSDTIFDRSWLSTYVYSKMLGINDKIVDTLVKINRDVFEEVFREYKVVIFTGNQPFVKADRDYYEKKGKWDFLNNLYKNLPAQYPDLDIKVIDVTNKTVPTVLYEVLEKVELVHKISIEKFLNLFGDEELVKELLWVYKILPDALLTEVELSTINELTQIILKEG